MSLTMNVQTAIALITEATTPKELFGKDPEQTYRTLAKLVHPDRLNGSPLRAAAEKAFARLTELYTTLTKEPPKPAVTVGKWAVTGPLAKGDICDLHLVEHGMYREAVLKIVRAERDNDLLEAEVKSLKAIHTCKHVPEKFLRYFPGIIESFKASGRRTAVESRAKGLNLLEILQHYPSGLDFRHVVWMMNRLLSALGYAHLNGIIHGAVFQEHLVYDTVNHDLTLVDWCYSVEANSPIRAIVRAYKDDYPPEVPRKKNAAPVTDLFMAAQALRTVAQEIPKPFKPLFELCLIQSPASRPSDAWKFQERWVETAKQVYGPPKFIPLQIPVH